jgi:hypothetical protein
MRSLIFGTLLMLSAMVCFVRPQSAASDDRCGEVVTVQTHDRSTTRNAFVSPPRAGTQGGPFTLRMRTQGAVWLVGTSRGSISALNAAARLSGPSAPDGIVLTSA